MGLFGFGKKPPKVPPALPPAARAPSPPMQPAPSVAAAPPAQSLARLRMEVAAAALQVHHAPEPGRPAAYARAVAALEARWHGPAAADLAGLLFLETDAWASSWPGVQGADRWPLMATATALTRSLAVHPSPGIVPELRRRLADMVGRAQTMETSRQVEALGELIVSKPPDEGLLDLMAEWVTGRIGAPGGPPFLPQNGSAILARLAERGRLTQALWLDLVTRGNVMTARVALSADATGRRLPLPGPERGRLLQWTLPWAEQACRDPTPAACATLIGLELEGEPSLLALAARTAAQHGLKKVPYRAQRWQPSIGAAVSVLAAGARCDRADPQARAKILKELESVPASFLALLLPVAAGSRETLLAQLGWGDRAPLVRLVEGVSGLDRHEKWWGNRRDMPSGPDEETGQVDPALVRQAMDAAGAAAAKQVLQLFKDAGTPTAGTRMAIEACMGWNQDTVEEGFARRDQVCVRVYGLLPLRKDSDLARRLQDLERFAADLSGGPQRQASERGAALAGMANLARNAGHADMRRMRWALRAKDPLKDLPSWKVQDAVVAITLQDGRPALAVTRGGKRSASVPKALAKEPQVAEAKAALAQAREDWLADRRSLEDAMVDGTEFDPVLLEGLADDAFLGPLLEALVFVDRKGRSGWLWKGRFVPEAGAAGKGPVRIAHPVDLLREGSLDRLQADLVTRRVVQPFKQVFREVYVWPGDGPCTRFEDLPVRSAQAARLLEARGWVPMSQGEPPQLCRGAAAVAWDVKDARNFLTELPEVRFGPLAARRRVDGAWRACAWQDVGPRLLSEAMRDADLVTRVASTGPPTVSSEVVARRAELLRRLLPLGQVQDRATVSGDQVFVQAPGGEFRVSLRDGSVAREPTGQAVAVPDLDYAGYLPFAPDEDEVAAKALATVEHLLKAAGSGPP